MTGHDGIIEKSTTQPEIKMNRSEALQALESINIARVSVHGEKIPAGFAFGDAVKALGSWGRASRYVSELTRVGKVNCRTIFIGGTAHDHYYVTGA